MKQMEMQKKRRSLLLTILSTKVTTALEAVDGAVLGDEEEIEGVVVDEILVDPEDLEHPLVSSVSRLDITHGSALMTTDPVVEDEPEEVVAVEVEEGSVGVTPVVAAAEAATIVGNQVICPVIAPLELAAEVAEIVSTANSPDTSLVIVQLAVVDVEADAVVDAVVADLVEVVEVEIEAVVVAVSLTHERAVVSTVLPRIKIRRFPSTKPTISYN